MCLNNINTMMTSNIKEFFVKNKKIFYYLWFFLVLFSLFSSSAFADGINTATAAAKDTTWAQKGIDFVNWLLQMVWVLLALATYLASMFLSPEWINGSLFWMSDKFKEIWILVSNVVYFVFAFVLIWIAFMNIIWKTWDQYQLKQALPKFIVWVLIVPFSWFLVQFILSISAILTVSSLTLPFDTFQAYWKSMASIKIPEICTLNLNEFKWNDTESNNTSAEAIKAEKNASSSNELIKCTWNVTLEWANATQSIFWIFSIYTYSILSFDSIDDFSAQFVIQTKTKTIWDVLVKVLFSALFVIVYWILIITLAMVLMIRWIYIWIYTMMSPIFWLMYFFDKKDGGWDWFFSKFNVKEFIALAMVPVYTMLALSFWLVFIYTVWQGLSTPAKTDTDIAIKWNTLSIWKSKLEIIWAYSNTTWEDITWFLDAIQKEWKGGLWVIWTLILKIFGIVVLWWTIMAAMRTSDITKAITEPIHSFGTKVWWIMASAPGNIPIFGWQSAKSMSSAVSNISSWIESAQSKKWLKLAEPFMWWSDKDKQYNTLATNTSPATWFAAWKNVEEILKVWKTEDIASNSNAIKWLEINISKMIKEKLIADNKETQKAMELLKNWKWNPNAIKEALMLFDQNAIWDKFSILWWSKKVGNITEVDNYTWSNTVINSFKELELPTENKAWGWFDIIWMTIEVKDWKIQDPSDYKTFANRFINWWYNWTITKEKFESRLDIMKLTSDEKEKFITEISKYVKDWKYETNWSWNWNLLFVESEEK